MQPIKESPPQDGLQRLWQRIVMAISSIASLNMIEYRMEKQFMCLLMLEAIEAIVKVKRKNDCCFVYDCEAVSAYF